MGRDFRKISPDDQSAIKAIFGERARFDPLERNLYSHDLSAPPPLVKPLIKNRPADGVVQPLVEDEVIALMRLADQRRIPLTPRGRSTSGYGGAIPRRGGLVVDFSRMNKIIEIDDENLTAAVEPGATWLNLESELIKKGLSLRLYPSSAPSSTVGGWLAQGGSGFGSYAFGWFGDNVESAKVVLPNGKTNTHLGAELDLVDEMEGITGLITEVKVKVTRQRQQRILAASFDKAKQLTETAKTVNQKELKLWSVSFVNPRMNKLRTLLKQFEGVRAIKGEEGYLAIFVFDVKGGDDEPTEAAIKSIIKSNSGRLLDDESAAKIWEERFEILKIKKFGPSLISTKAAVPLNRMQEALDCCNRIAPEMVIEGILLKGKAKDAQAILLGFIPHDQRKLLYSLAYSLSLSFVKFASSIGGRPCGTGIYFRGRAPQILGADRVRALLKYKKEIDPNQILNPDKVIGTDALDALMTTSWELDALTRTKTKILGPWMSSGIGKDNLKANTMRAKAYVCDQCGFCIEGCAAHKNWESQTPRGCLFFLRNNAESDPFVLQWKAACRKCDACTASCPLGLLPLT